jgi:hypothetical protein
MRGTDHPRAPANQVGEPVEHARCMSCLSRIGITGVSYSGDCRGVRFGNCSSTSGGAVWRVQSKLLSRRWVAGSKSTTETPPKVEQCLLRSPMNLFGPVFDCSQHGLGTLPQEEIQG